MLGSTEPSSVGKTHCIKTTTFAKCFTSFQSIFQLQLTSLILSASPLDLFRTLHNMAVLRSSREDSSSQAARLPAKDTFDSDSSSEQRHTCPQTLTTTGATQKIRQPQVSSQNRSHRNAPPDSSNLRPVFKQTCRLEEQFLESC